MTKFFIKILFLVSAFGFVGLTDNYAQDSEIASDWEKISVCNISFFIPKDLKNNNKRGIDSCVASFSNNEIGLTIDYGWYNSPSKKYETYTDFKEEFIEIDGKKAQFATYRHTLMNANQNLVATIYVVLDKTKEHGVGMTTSLDMTIVVRNEKDLETAKQIFQSIRFDK